ncbi:helix-turn-helix domain-containing protein [Streptomyces sp. G1]|uniref:helix-turn-helix domain-containing protein n=1 Tax=Streptomyces sp. G1 TaxID=361572 RepID=UPI002030B0BE|nr:helix-turn-helix domain-containing protein [Streptomyces sp. G1]MCM1966563.1 helix-turn-helix domain-containing protein [Streptomyces sp. G1]
MARWKELPSGLDSREGRLVAELRRLKDRSGLSLAALAAKTGYSRSSWERYLNGKQPVPHGAVEQLARLCGADETRLLVLHEVAVRARRQAPPAPVAGAAEVTGGTANGPAGGVTPGPEPTAVPAPRIVRLRTFLAGIAAAVVVAFGAGLLTGGAWADDAAHGEDAGTSGYRRGVAYECDTQRKDGELRAGHSTSREILLDTNSTGFDVVEVQCLLREHGFDPKTTDGLYGQDTKAAATRFQAARGLVTDGIVGPKTWAELRK